MRDYPAIESEDFVLNGIQFRLETFRDEGMREPWKEHDGHGIVSDWTTRDKTPGERVMVRDGRSARYYDIQATLKMARREGWDAEPYGGTKGEQAARAVEADFKRMKAWCEDEWQWLWLKVTMLDADGEPTDEYETLGGIEGDSGMSYFRDEAKEMASEICERMPDESDAGDIPIALAR